MKDKDYELFFEAHGLTGSTGVMTNNFTQYKVNVNNIETINDVKLILKHLDLHFSPRTKEEYESMKHLLIIN